MKILITGVHGLIGGALYKHFSSQADTEVFGMARRRQASERVKKGQELEIPDRRLHIGDLQDSDAVASAVAGMDVVIHMAADARADAPWNSIHRSNVTGSYHVFEMCRQAGVRRVLFASSIMVSWGYFSDEPYASIQDGRFENVPLQIPIVSHQDPTRPIDLYSASKVWGEALARVYAHVHGLSCLCLRIGWVNGRDEPWKPDLASVWSSQRDIVQLVEKCALAPPSLQFDIFYGVSDNRFRWVDIEHARRVVGYEPEDGSGT